MNYTNAYPAFYKLINNEQELCDFIGNKINYWIDEKGKRHLADVDGVNRMIAKRIKEIFINENKNAVFWTVDKLTKKQEKVTVRPANGSYLMGIENYGYKYLFAMDDDNCIFINYSKADAQVNRWVNDRWEFMPEESDSFGVYHGASGYYIYNTYQAFCAFSKEMHNTTPRYEYNKEFYLVIQSLVNRMEFYENKSSYVEITHLYDKQFQVKLLAVGWTLIVYEMTELLTC